MSSIHIGYVYTPPSVNDEAHIWEWFGSSQLQPGDIDGSFLKVAHVADLSLTSAVDIYHLVYVDFNAYPNMTPSQFVPPSGWVQVPVIQRVAEPTVTALDEDEFMSMISSFSKGIWPNPPSVAHVVGQASAVAPVLAVGTVPVVGTAAAVPAVPQFFATFIPPPSEATIATLPPTDPDYVMCSPLVFDAGIKYDIEYLECHFPAAHICIQDAKILAKHFLNTHSLDRIAFKTYCFEAIIEMVSIARICTQPVELASLVVSKLYSERAGFMKSLKGNLVPLIDEEGREHLGGYCLQSRDPATISVYISGLTGLMAMDRVVRSIDFTRDQLGRPYRQIHEESMVDLFPDDYTNIPEDLISTVCAMYMILLRSRFTGQVQGMIFARVVQMEARHQLDLLRAARQGASGEAAELNHWLTTRYGPGGWEFDLQRAMALANRQHGPQP
ncbi:hypothetical protein DFH29DRAFT_1006139 [Suillus ampliporus]|nr:hypothetical protein DFH29DRAFT_1006139 [Suillus ampliporus]